MRRIFMSVFINRRKMSYIVDNKMKDASSNQDWMIVLSLVVLYLLIVGKGVLNGSHEEARVIAFAKKLIPFWEKSRNIFHWDMLLGSDT